MSPVLQFYVNLVVFVLGAVVGSFLNVCIHRLPRGTSIVSPPSHCPQCNTPIPWYHNIPLVSYFLLKGRCRSCGAPFAFRYWVVEFLNALLWLLIWQRFQADHNLAVVAAYWVLTSMLLVGTFIDFEFYIIPDRITLGSVVIGFILSLVAPALHQTSSHAVAALRSFVGILVGGLVLLLVAELGKLAFGRRKVALAPGSVVEIEESKIKFQDEELRWEDVFARASDRIHFHAASLRFLDQSFENVEVRISEGHIKINDMDYDLGQVGKIEAVTESLVIPREAMGMGDVKLLAGIGAFLGWKGTLFSVFSSSIVGGIVSVLLILLNKKDWQSRIPYGPYIALGALIWLFGGRELVDWYVSLLQR